MVSEYRRKRRKIQNKKERGGSENNFTEITKRRRGGCSRAGSFTLLRVMNFHRFGCRDQFIYGSCSLHGWSVRKLELAQSDDR